MEQQYAKPNRSCGPQMKITIDTSQHSDNDRSSGELRALDCNRTSLCDHIQIEGFNSGSFSDVVVHAMGSTYCLHRLIISRSSYFRNMLQGPWKEANAPIVTLHVDDKNVNDEAIEMALAYLYGHHPKLNDNNAFRVLAAASFLDLQDLCAICTDFIISELWTSNILSYQVFAESQDYGIHGQRVRSACWGCLCQSGAMELKGVLPKLSCQTLHGLLTSNKLWVPSEEKRFELALFTFLAKAAMCEQEHSEQINTGSEEGIETHSDSSNSKGKNLIDKRLESEQGCLVLKDNTEGHNNALNLLVELADCVVDFKTGVTNSKRQLQQDSCPLSKFDSGYSRNMEGSSSNNACLGANSKKSSSSYAENPVNVGASGLKVNGEILDGPSDEGYCCQLNNICWFNEDDPSRHCTLMNSSNNDLISNDWGRCGIPTLSCSGRVVGRRQLKGYAKGNLQGHGEEYDSFVNIFEGDSLLYCNMSFEALLNVRKQLEEFGFPCKAVNDGLWMQMVLSQRVQEIGINTCKSCCLTSNACVCQQSFGCVTGYYMQEQAQNNSLSNSGNVYVAESATGDGNAFRPVRVPVRGPIDGLAGIGRGTTFVPAAAWPPTRFVFSRVPFGVGNRYCQQSLANDDSEGRADHNGDLSKDGLTALVRLSQGGSQSANGQGEQLDRGYEMDMQNSVSGTSMAEPSTSGVPLHMLESSGHASCIQWQSTNSSSISLDMKTPLSDFPPFRFGVQFDFEDVHRLNDGQVKHSPEFYYAGSLWKVSVQVFNDEDPQGRRTLGLFIHRRKADITISLRKVHMFVDTREKVTARYQLSCPSKREIMVFGSIKQPGTLLPKAPKGWGWRSALLFDELNDLLQNGALRVAAVVKLV